MKPMFILPATAHRLLLISHPNEGKNQVNPRRWLQNKTVYLPEVTNVQNLNFLNNIGLHEILDQNG